MTDAATTQVISGLSEIIQENLRDYSREYWSPRYSSDQSEAELRFAKQRILELRKMREDFENLMFGLEKDSL